MGLTVATDALLLNQAADPPLLVSEHALDKVLAERHVVDRATVRSRMRTARAQRAAAMQDAFGDISIATGSRGRGEP